MASQDDEQNVEYLQSPIGGVVPNRIAELGSMTADLEFALSCFDAYTKIEGVGEQDGRGLIRRALWNSGLISYRRAFTTGRSLVLARAGKLRLSDQLVDMLDDDGKKAHSDAWMMANQHVAHRVAPTEQAQIVALLEPPPAERNVVGLSMLSVYLQEPEAGLTERVITVCNFILDVLEQNSQLLVNELMENLRTTESLDSLYANLMPPIPAAAQGNATYTVNETP